MTIPFLRYRKVYYGLSILLVTLSLASIFIFGLKPGIDFTGGTIIELDFEGGVPDKAILSEKLKDLDLGQVSFQTIGNNGLLIRTKHISEEIHQEILDRIEGESEQRYETIGSLIGEELRSKTKYAIVFSLLGIICYIAFAFRKVSRPAKSWQYGIAALVALFHDLLIPLGVFSLLGHFYGVEMSIPLITALLTVLGYSISDTVVVFDRIRENLLKSEKGKSFEETVEGSLNQTLVRSTNTGLSVLFVLLSLFFFGGDNLRYFSLMLIVGILCGTYSSIFIASPLLVSWIQLKRKGS